MDDKKKTGKKVKHDVTISKQIAAPLPPAHPPIDEELLKSVEKFVLEITKQKVKENKDFSALESVVSEWLKCFIIVGFDLQGKPIVIGHSPTEQDYLSLLEHFRYTLIKIMMQRDSTSQI